MSEKPASNPAVEAPQPQGTEDWREGLTDEQYEIQLRRDDWEEAFPGKSVRTPEGDTIGLEDLARLEAAAENYGFELFDRQGVLDVYEEIQDTADHREAELRQKYLAKGVRQHVIDRLVAEERDKAMQEARQQQVDSYGVEDAADAGGRQRRRIAKERETLNSLLSLDPEEFSQLQAEWEAYEDVMFTKEQDSLHSEALKQDKKKKSYTQRRRLKAELTVLDDNNGGALEYLSQFPVESDPRIAEVVTQYKEEAGQDKDDEDLLSADREQALDDLKWRLGELLAQKTDQAGNRLLSDKQIGEQTKEAAGYLKDWLSAIAESEGDPLAELREYKNKMTAYEKWGNRRRLAAEYLGPVLVARAVRSRLNKLAEKIQPPKLEAGKWLKWAVDPSRIGLKNSAKALRHADILTDRDVKVFEGGWRGEIQTAVNYYRHEHALLMPAFLMAGAARGLKYNLWSAWQSLPEEQRRKEKKKNVLGKVAVAQAHTVQLKKIVKSRAGRSAAGKES